MSRCLTCVPAEWIPYHVPGSCKGPIFEPPTSFPNGRHTRGIHFYCQWDALKATFCGEKNHSELPRPLNLKHNLEVSHDANWSFHTMMRHNLKLSTLTNVFPALFVFLGMSHDWMLQWRILCEWRKETKVSMFVYDSFHWRKMRNKNR